MRVKEKELVITTENIQCGMMMARHNFIEYNQASLQINLHAFFFKELDVAVAS